MFTIRGTGRLALVVLALAVVWPSAAQGGVRDFRIGVVAKFPRPIELERMRQGGVGVMRANFSWSLVQSTRGGSFRWDRYDGLMTNAALSGQPIFPTIMGSAEFAAGETHNPPQSDKDLRAWERFVKALVRRYGRDGDFWTDPANAELPYMPLTEWQVWNEPNLRYFWNDDPDGREYAKFVIRTSDAIGVADPQARVVLGGMVTGHLGEYLDDFYAVPGVKKRFEAAASHPYSPKVSEVKARLRSHRDLLDAHGESRTPLWVTESGWAAGGPQRDLTTSPEGQADRLREAFGFFREEREALRLGTVLWFNWRDIKERTEQEGKWWEHAGLFWLDGQPKPAWKAFVELTGGERGTGGLGRPR